MPASLNFFECLRSAGKLGLLETVGSAREWCWVYHAPGNRRLALWSCIGGLQTCNHFQLIRHLDNAMVAREITIHMYGSMVTSTPIPNHAENKHTESTPFDDLYYPLFPACQCPLVSFKSTFNFNDLTLWVSNWKLASQFSGWCHYAEQFFVQVSYCILCFFNFELHETQHS